MAFLRGERVAGFVAWFGPIETGAPPELRFSSFLGGPPDSGDLCLERSG